MGVQVGDLAPGWVSFDHASAHQLPDADVPRTLPEIPRTLPEALAHAERVGRELSSPGNGKTRPLWEHLATLAAVDLGVARAVEPHLDACAIFTQAGLPLPAGTWGVFAAEGGTQPLRATREAQGWVLSGEKPWCSLAGQLDGALVTAHTPDGRGLFAVDLKHRGVRVLDGRWKARGLAEIPSGPVQFDSVPATAVGDPGWYLERDGFWWGGIGVAACWYGGAVGIARTLGEVARDKPDPHRSAHLGAIDTMLHACRLALLDAAAAIDTDREVNGPLLAHRVRGLVARSCEEVLMRAGHALGPAPLALDEAHAKRVSDLALYIRQHHAERDEAAQGALLVEAWAQAQSQAPIW